ncbi:ABC transporter permease [Hydrogenophaga sp. MI9]|uniref:ABC transporter permease n=1 Tax=Hydrogenophaga sp. MI9 TaxID=3453719 RepID=UPI003EE94EA5
MNALMALWRYRGFILGSVQREFQSKYRNSLLGAAWNIVNPLSMIIVYTVIFANLMRTRLPGAQDQFSFSIYLCAGILTWGLFAEITNRATGMFIENANLIKKLSFPRLCLPVVVVANSLVNFGILFGLFLLFLVISGHFPGWVILAVIPLLILQVLFAIGVGISLGVLNVFFRDVGQFFALFLSFWFWFTPIVYPVSVLPESVQSLMRYNPMARVIEGYQQVLLHASMPNWYSLWPVALLTALLCVYGLWQFRRHVGEMVDEL